MNKFHKVVVDWVDGKKNDLPRSGEYITVARFPQDEDSWPFEAWSILLRFYEGVDSQPCMADARFLSSQAPEGVIRSGVCFELLEGSKVSAKVRVV